MLLPQVKEKKKREINNLFCLLMVVDNSWVFFCLFCMQQSAAFKILRTRLKTVPTYSFSGGDQQISRASSVPFAQYHEDGDRKEDKNINTSHQGINFDARLQQFEKVQNQHRGLARTKVNYSYSSSSSSTSKVTNNAIQDNTTC